MRQKCGSARHSGNYNTLIESRAYLSFRRITGLCIIVAAFASTVQSRISVPDGCAVTIIAEKGYGGDIAVKSDSTCK